MQAFPDTLAALIVTQPVSLRLNYVGYSNARIMQGSGQRDLQLLTVN
jgi:hypothetical protein